ncbi:unnamed protein product [Protopolystoma xenopodis]|uniref:Uncharacterized protein n=1 Tax=Protopolystoma xenopodis TaxID=117903 RepID=A0A448X043_9PLAT|nr:unnamed protein product [Protopolystoma xenopodis]
MFRPVCLLYGHSASVRACRFVSPGVNLSSPRLSQPLSSGPSSYSSAPVTASADGEVRVWPPVSIGLGREDGLNLGAPVQCLEKSQVSFRLPGSGPIHDIVQISGDQ